MRCSHPDGSFKTTSKSAALVPKNGVIYWHIDEKYLTPDMKKEDIVAAFDKAFAAWQPYFAPIKLESTSDIYEAPIVIRFMNNGDRGLPSKFSGNTLAYAYFPQKGSLGIHSDMYFNDKYRWALMHSRAHTNLFKVAVHELGHAFGIDHTQDIQDIMYPQYQPNDSVVLTEDTQAAIDYLYGQYGAGQNTEKAEMGIFTKISNWFNDALISRVVGMLVRRAIDVVSGALLASTLPILVSLGNWVVENNLEIEASLVGAAMLAVSVVLSYLQKKKDVVELRKLGFRR